MSAAQADNDEKGTADLGDLSDLGNGELRVFADLGDYGLVVCRVDGTLHAVEDNCSHADTPLSEGRLRGCMLTCPLHGAQFDVRDGSHSGPPAWEGVATFAVTESPEGAVVDLTPADQDGPANTDVGGRFNTR